MSTCPPYCSEATPPLDPVCFAESILVCTRKVDHDGPHVACGTEHQLDTWEDPPR